MAIFYSHRTIFQNNPLNLKKIGKQKKLIDKKLWVYKRFLEGENKAERKDNSTEV